MKSNSLQNPFLACGRIAAAAVILAGAGLPPLRAQTRPVITLDEMVVSAQRSSQQINQTPSAITLVPLEELDTTGINSLQTALGQQPGTVIVMRERSGCWVGPTFSVSIL